MELSYTQLKWLNEHGGRTRSDVLVDEKGFYVKMYSGKMNAFVKIYLPK